MLPAWCAGFPGGPRAEEPSCQRRRSERPGSVPGSGRPPGGGHSHPFSVLAWSIAWTEEPGGPQSVGRRDSDTTERVSTACRAPGRVRACAVGVPAFRHPREAPSPRLPRGRQRVPRDDPRPLPPSGPAPVLITAARKEETQPITGECPQREAALAGAGTRLCRLPGGGLATVWPRGVLCEPHPLPALGWASRVWHKGARGLGGREGSGLLPSAGTLSLSCSPDPWGLGF